MAKMLYSWYVPQYSKENKGIPPINKCIYYSELLDKLGIDDERFLDQYNKKLHLPTRHRQ